MKVVSREQMGRIEREADAGGLAFDAMMENAGKALAEVVMSRHSPMEAVRVLILIGPGNNGGDGLVAARHLAQAGAHVHLYLLVPRPEGDPNWQQCQKIGIPYTLAEDDEGAALGRLLARAHGVVDALLGTGKPRPIEGRLEGILEAVAEERARRAEDRGVLAWLTKTPPAPARSPWVAACDLPSGMDCDTGEADPATLPADLTVTFAHPKLGHFRFPGAGLTGELVVADIGIPPELAEDVAVEAATPQMVRGLLPARPPDAHKGTFGKALIVVGSTNYVGAACLAAEGALRAGAGLVTVATPRPIHPIVATKLTEPTYLVLPHEMGVISEEAYDVLAEVRGGYDAILVGPGLGREPATGRFLERLIRGEKARGRQRMGFVRTQAEPEGAPGRDALPMALDADALNLLSEHEEWWKQLSAGNVLTPHPGEMARLAGADVGEIEADRLGRAAEAAREWGQVVLLKGAYTAIAAPDGRITINPFANPGLASGGTGDVLAGIVVSLLAQGVRPYEAAVAGAFVHGLAGEKAACAVGETGMVASDVAAAVAPAIRDLRGGCPQPAESR